MFVKLTRLNDAGNPSGPVYINSTQVVMVIGEDAESAVRVVTTAGEVRVEQPQGEGKTPIHEQLD